jgi:hypothetical protein
MLERTLPLELSDLPSLPSGRAALDAVATVTEDGERMVVAVINLSPDAAYAPEFNLDGTGYRLQRRLLYASDREEVRERADDGGGPQEAGSIGFYFFTK